MRRSGQLGHNETISVTLQDGKFLSDRIKMEGVPHFVMGHSMGGGIALRFVAEYPQGIQGVIVSGMIFSFEIIIQTNY